MTTAEAPPFEQGDCYKYQWARHVARKTLHDDLRGVRALINQMKNADGGSGPGSGLLVPDLPADTSINDLYKLTEKATGGGLTPPDPARFNVGIVGAGAAGLFTALLFDWLNGHPEVRDQLHIDYDVLEANGADRLGGRLFTHRFSDDEHDYYDVGAMRFPDNNIMSRYVKQALQRHT
jgi:hypothetical protein